MTPLRHDEACPPRRCARLSLGLGNLSAEVKPNSKEAADDACAHDRATAREGNQSDRALEDQREKGVSEGTRVHRLIPFSASAASIFWSFHRW